MNTPRLSFLAAWLVLAAAPAFAAFESIKIPSDNELPPFPITLIADGITTGRAVAAVSINADGKVDDLLMLGYSHERLARMVAEALKRWRFVPARLDGQPVGVLTELHFDFTVQGAVITSNLTERYLAEVSGRPLGSQLIRQPCPRDELDRVPVKVAGDAPRYAVEAAKEGVRGSVQVHFYIDEKGVVRMPAVQNGSHPYLMEMAIEAMKGWKFEPPTSRGRPVLVAAAQTFDFGGGNR